MLRLGTILLGINSLVVLLRRAEVIGLGGPIVRDVAALGLLIAFVSFVSVYCSQYAARRPARHARALPPLDAHLVRVRA